MEKEEPLFFLFTCVKDGRQFIEKLFESLLTQTKKNFVHYIYEDGSDNPLDEIVESYIQRVEQLKEPYRVIYEKCDKNIGLNKATEHCLKKCFLNYFIWINCDDWLDSDFFNNAEIYIKKHPNYAIYRSKMISHYGNDTQVTPSSKKEARIFAKHNQVYPCLSYQFLFNHFICNLQLFKKVNPDLYLIDNRLVFNDVQVCLPLVFKNFQIGYLKESISHFLYRDNSEYNGSNKQFILELCDENAESFVECFLLYQKCLNYGNDFLINLKNKNYKNARKILKERNSFLKNNGYKYSKVRILNKNPRYWSFYCFLKLVVC